MTEWEAGLYVADPETCPTHGRMNFDFDLHHWICHGFDGEGCECMVKAEWQRIGDIEPPHIQLGRNHASTEG